MSGAAHERLRARLYATFRGSATPLLMGRDFGIPGASLWSGARQWVTRLREAGLGPGDRVVVGLDRRPAHVMAVMACWWEGLTARVVAPSEVDACERGRAGGWVGAGGAGLVIAERAGPGRLTVIHDDLPGPGPGPKAGPGPEAGVAVGVEVISAGVGARGGVGTGVALELGSGRWTYAALEALLEAAAPSVPRPGGVAHAEPSVMIEHDEAWHTWAGLLGPRGLWPALLGGATIVVEPEASPARKTG